MAKRCGFPPVYKIERVEKLSAKRVFFGVLQKIMVICCTIFFGFTNAFSANLPSGYTELEYIESTGTQYIVLPIFPANAQNLEITTDVLHTDGTNEQIFFSNAGAGGSIQALFTTGTAWRTWRSSAGGFNLAYWDTRHIFTIKMTSSVVEYYVDGVKKTDVPANLYNSTDGFSDYALNLGARTKSNGSADYFWKGKIYKFSAKCNDNICINLIPVKNSSNAIGMYDTVSNTFFTNAGTGTFVAGPEVLPIKIATTAYNSARFSPVQTDLNNAVATIREIVTKTINQTAAIASLQADKQTRPEDACPAGKKCLLVETEENGVIVPHWFPIIEAPEE